MSQAPNNNSLGKFKSRTSNGTPRFKDKETRLRKGWDLPWSSGCYGKINMGSSPLWGRERWDDTNNSPWLKELGVHSHLPSEWFQYCSAGAYTLHSEKFCEKNSLKLFDWIWQFCCSSSSDHLMQRQCFLLTNSVMKHGLDHQKQSKMGLCSVTLSWFPTL